MFKNNTSIHKKVAAIAASLALVGSVIASVPYFAASNPVQGGGGIGDSDAAISAAQAASIGGNLANKRTAAIKAAEQDFRYAETGIAPYDGSSSQSCYNSTTRTFNINSSNDFIWMLNRLPYVSSATNTTYVNINVDVDCNGQKYNYGSVKVKNIHVEGNGHTIYNFRSEQGTGTQAVGVFGEITDGFTMKNLAFSNCYITGGAMVGIVGQTYNGLTIVENCYMHECYIRALDSNDAGGKAGFIGRPGSTGGSSAVNTIGQSSFDKVGVSNSAIIGDMHIGSVAGFYNFIDFTDCYAEDNLVISTGGHCGSFAGCSNGWNTYTRCWSNSIIYGNAQVGGFTSGFDGLGANYTDCFSSGIVEGETEIGGFVGFASYYRWGGYPRKTTFTRCYSTCAVGMNYQASYAGGFIGRILSNEMSVSMEECYATGEVGSIDTDIEVTQDCGGMIGVIENNAKCTISNCYYDMQSTAMRNKAIGSVAPLSTTRDSSDGGVSTTSWNGIRGLSTDMLAGKSPVSLFSSGYTFSPGLYPQLLPMATHSNPKFCAASAASTATVFCDSWSELPAATTFDTVRDIVRPVALSSNTPFTSNPSFSAAYVDDPHIVDITWSTDGNKTPIDKETSVVTLPSSSPYYTASLMPGIEWLTVNVTYKDDNGQTATGSRRLRLIPTSFIAAGDDKQLNVSYEDGINKTPLYDHNNGFSATYLDAKTLQSYMESSTAHTDSLKTFSDCSPAASYTDDSALGSVSLPFNASYKTMELGMSILSRDGSEMRISPIASKLTGALPLDTPDFGIYDLSYKAAVPDGRYLSASKSLAVVGEFSVVYNYNYHGLLAGKNISPRSIFSIQSELEDFDEFDMYAYGDAPIRDGWRFSYWSLDEDGLEPVSQSWFDTYADRVGELNENINLYAQYSRSTAGTSTLTLVPGIGSYQEHAVGENVVLTGAPGDKMVISSANAPDNWIFDGWTATELGGGTLHKSSTSDWVFTFGEGDASIAAEYHPTVFAVSVHRVNKHSREDISEPWEGVQQAGERYEVSVADGVDASFYNVETAEIRVYDADTSEELALDDLNVTVSDDGTIYAYDMPGRNIRIEITYDTWIQMPETGMPWACVLAVFGSVALSAACIGMMASRYRRSN